MSDTSNSYAQAIAYLEVDQAHLAIPILASYLSAHPDDSLALASLSEAFLSLGESARSRDAAIQSLASWPENTHALRVLAFAHAQLGEMAAARAAAEEAQRIAPDDWLTHLVRARLDLTPSGGTPKGKAAVETMLALAPDVAECHVVAADHLVLAQGPLVFEEQREEARAHLRSALNIDPQNSDAVASLGRLELRVRQRRAQGARTVLGALAMDPTNPRNRGLLFTTIRISVREIALVNFLLLLVALALGSALEADREPGSLSGFMPVAVVMAVLAVGYSAVILGRLLAAVRGRVMVLLRALPRISTLLTVRVVIIFASLLVLIILPFVGQFLAVEIGSWTLLALLVSGIAVWFRGFTLN